MPINTIDSFSYVFGLVIIINFVPYKLKRRKKVQYVRDNPFLPLHVKKLIKLSFFQVFLKGNPPDALLVLSFGMKTNTPMTTTI